MWKSDDTEFNPKKSFIFKKLRKVLPYTSFMDEEKFFICRMGIRVATPLFMALIIIELTDILFALDSIPAILAITADPFIVFSSNILAILGLRSMYIIISRMLNKFRYINYSLVVILAYVGLKLIFSHHIEIPEWLSLAVIGLSLTGGIFASVMIPGEKPEDLLENKNALKQLRNLNFGWSSQIVILYFREMLNLGSLA